jgi:hypothetical protein
VQARAARREAEKEKGAIVFDTLPNQSTIGPIDAIDPTLDPMI